MQLNGGSRFERVSKEMATPALRRLMRLSVPPCLVWVRFGKRLLAEATIKFACVCECNIHNRKAEGYDMHDMSLPAARPLETL